MFVLLAATVLAADPTPTKPPPLTLTGVVRDAAGRPLPKATVFIRTAGPRKGVGVL
jgi:hypothetical protein